MKGNLLTVFARNCDVRRIDKPLAEAFMNENHIMGYATSRYGYGLFVRRVTSGSEVPLPGDTLVAVSLFSNARRWKKGASVVSSYEWIRYASRSDLRVVGGMGKLLNAFVSDVNPDDVMTYADPRWSDGEVYRRLGFESEGLVNKPGFTCVKLRLKLNQAI